MIAPVEVCHDFHYFLQISCTGYGGRVTSSRDPIVIKIYFRGLHADNMTQKKLFWKILIFSCRKFCPNIFAKCTDFCWILLNFPTVSLYNLNQPGIQNSDFSDLHDKKELELHIWRLWSTNQYYNLVQYYPTTPSHLRKIWLLIFWWSDDL